MKKDSLRGGKEFSGCMSGFFHLFEFGQAIGHRKCLPSHSLSVHEKHQQEENVYGERGQDGGNDKRRVSNVVAKLMGLEEMPEHSKEEQQKPKDTKRQDKEDIKYPIALSKSRSVTNLSEEIIDCESPQLRSHSFREHPQEKQLEQFKKEFRATQDHSCHYEPKCTQETRHRRSKSREFLDALDYLKKHEDVIFKAHHLVPKRDSNAKVQSTNAKKMANNLVQGQRLKACTSQGATKAKFTDKIVVLKPSAPKERQKSHSAQHVKSATGSNKDKWHSNEDKCLTKKVVKKHCFTESPKVIQCSKLSSHSKNNRKQSPPRSSKRVSENKENEHQKAPRESTSRSSYSNNDECYGHGKEKCSSPNRGGENGYRKERFCCEKSSSSSAFGRSTKGSRFSSPPDTKRSSHASHYETMPVNKLPEPDESVFMQDQIEFPSPNSVLDGPSMESPSPISVKEMTTDFQELSRKLTNLKFNEESQVDNVLEKDIPCLEEGDTSVKNISLCLAHVQHPHGNTEKEERYTYVRTIMVAAGFGNDDVLALSRWHSDSEPINPELFTRIDKLEYKSRDTFCISKHTRKLLFDLVNEIMSKKVREYREPLTWMTKNSMPRLRYMPTGEQLMQQVWDEICGIRQVDCRVLQDVDGLVGADIAVEVPLKAMHGDIEVIGLRLEHLVFDMLLEEVVLDGFCAY